MQHIDIPSYTAQILPKYAGPIETVEWRFIDNCFSQDIPIFADIGNDRFQIFLLPRIQDMSIQKLRESFHGNLAVAPTCARMKAPTLSPQGFV